MIRRSAFAANLSLIHDSAVVGRMASLDVGDDSGAIAGQQAVIFLEGHADSSGIQERIEGMDGLSLVAARLVGDNGSTHSPSMAYLVTGHAPLDALETLLRDDSIPEEHRRALHVCTDANEIERLFPSPSSAPMEADTSATASSDSVITPEQERRVFTYIAEEEEEDEHNPVTQLAHSQSAKHTVSTAMRTESASPIGVNGRKSLLSSNMIQTPLKPRGVGPTITPRLSKAAALRMGVPLPEVTPRRPATAESDRLNDRPLPGITRRPVTPPKSLAKPGITPRGTKASLLRQEGAGGSVNDSFTVRQPTKRRESCGTSERSSMYEGLAGFGNRRRSVASTSTASSQVRAKVAVPNGLDMSETIGRGLSWKPHAPTVPRAALSTAERAAQSAASSGRSLPGIDRRSSVSSLMQPSIQPRVNRATALRNGMDGEDGDRRSSVRSPHSNGRATPSLSSRASPLPPSDRSDGLRSPPPAVRPPSITPRVNRAAELRMAQMAK